MRDAWTDHARKSGIYRFPIREFAKQAILITPQSRARYLIYEM
ncbi:hypothetical protein QNI19_08650 [Cytophagaceae bacterium DM2B3-1]|uniref:Uncharacterized protein n=1 Tax=Xanthocytophaga flava TaxID=3048013 RepID=A0ABT7CJZ4_9BACT|nr:hypothetical protein [Xanthocytophaga flavus]MDJ1492999.1 hypothetical protein [Xanthocytophaga flavus]